MEAIMDTIVDSLFCFFVTLGEWERIGSVVPSGAHLESDRWPWVLSGTEAPRTSPRAHRVGLFCRWCVDVRGDAGYSFSVLVLLIRNGADHPLSPWKRSRDGRRGESMRPANSTVTLLLLAGRRSDNQLSVLMEAAERLTCLEREEVTLPLPVAEVEQEAAGEPAGRQKQPLHRGQHGVRAVQVRAHDGSSDQRPRPQIRGHTSRPIRTGSSLVHPRVLCA